MHIPKKGLRALGIAESFSGREHSTLAGIVMRKDLIIDGFAFSRGTVGGMDATDAVPELVNTLNRRDINVIFLSGCVIAFFNIIDPAHVLDRTGLPVVCVTYEESTGLEGEHLPPFSGRYRTAGCVPPAGHSHSSYPAGRADCVSSQLGP